jgi:antirestriction protein ArdC
MTTTFTLPTNPTTGREFTRGNAARLMEAAEENGYTSGQWATFVQWKNAGRVVVKGQHGTKCLLPKIEKNEDGTEAATGKIVRGFTVFALEQTEPLS